MTHYAMLKAKGLCTMCGKVKPIEGKTKCEECTRICNERMRKRYDMRKAARLCVSCGEKLAETENSTLCAVCSKIMSVKFAEASRVRMAKKRVEMLAKGLCVRCGKNPPRIGSNLCESCLEKGRLWSRKRAEERRESGLCSICGRALSAEDGDYMTCEKCRERARRNNNASRERRKQA